MAQKSKVEELHLLWISEGMSCDGDSVAMTAATQPSIEDVVLGLIPGIPKVHLHNKVLAKATGDDLVAPFHAAARGRTGAVRLRGRGLDSQRGDPRGRVLHQFRLRPRDRPADHAEPVDRPAGAQGAGGGGGRHLRHLWRHSRHGRQSHRVHGTGRLLGLGFPHAGGHSHRQRPRLPHPAGQLHGDAALAALPGGGQRPDDPAGRASCAPRGSSARRCTRAAIAPATTSRAISPRTTTRPSAR